MSNTDSMMNRREAMRMLGASFMGAATLGGYTYFATETYQRKIAEADVDAALKENPNSPSTKQELMAMTDAERQATANGYAKAASALGALIGTEYYDWDTPDPFSPALD